MDIFSSKKRAQVTIFIIIAVLAVAGVALYFVLSSDSVSQANLPAELQEAENAFLSCIETETQSGVDLLLSNAGYIDSPEFEPGSRHMPFSSHLNFAGNPIPYWHYISGNNFERENVPSQELMESQLASFIEGQVVENCNLQEIRNQGYEIRQGEEVATDVNIEDNEVQVTVERDLAINRGNQSALVEEHSEEVGTNLGSLFESAKRVYEHEREENFLEDYGVDVLNSYAPVSGIELSCSPKTWNADNIFNDLESAVQANTLSLKNSGAGDDYHNVDLPVSENVGFLNYEDWPSTYEVEPSEGSTMISEPIGDERGLDALGFCFVTYQFAYDMKYPVMVQVSEGEETFQFPVGVVIENNVAKGSTNVTVEDSENETEINFCENKNTDANVEVRDLSGDSVDASISYSCFGQSCRIGQSSEGSLEGQFPQCVNGFVTSRAEGYETTSQQFSTVDGNNSLTVYMEKLHDLNVNLNLDGSAYNEEAVISFVSEDTSRTAVYPGQDSVSLSEGNYNVSVRVHENVSLDLEEASSQQCVDVPTGVPGVTNERCFDLDVPSGIDSRALTGGGETQKVLLNSDLENSDSIEINAESLPTPESVEDLRVNYEEFEDKSVEVNLI